MAGSNFHIAYVERGMEHLWRQFWVTGEKTPEVVSAHEAGHLGRVEYLVAPNLRAAIAEVQRRHPNCTVMRDGCGRLGRA